MSNSIFHDRGRDARFTGHSYPDAVLRVGLFADWFEFPRLTAGQMLPGLIYPFSWQVVEDRLFFSGLFEADRVVDDSAHPYVQLAQTLEVKYAWTCRFKTFLEWVALYPTSALDPGAGQEYYLHSGMIFLISNNIQLDAHVFIGLNEHAIDFFGGPGLSIRY